MRGDAGRDCPDPNRDQLVELVRRLADRPGAAIAPHWRRDPGKPDRLRQLLADGPRAVLAGLTGRRRVMLMGEGLRTVTGPVSIRRRPGARAVLAALGARNPVLAVSSSDETMTRFCAALGLDPADEVEVQLSANAALTVTGRVGGHPAIGHIAIGEYGLASVWRHRTGLTDAHAARLPAPVAALLPQPLGGPDKAVFLQTRVPGRPMTELPLTEERLAECLDRAAAPLWHLHEHGAARAAGPDMVGLRQALRTMPERLPDGASDLIGRAVGQALAWLARRPMHGVPVHGDYWPSNILITDDDRVCGLVDWEWFRPRGLPGYDALYLLATTLAHSRGEKLARVLRQICIEGERGTVFRGFHRQIARRTGFSEDDMGCLGLVLWLGVIRRTVIDTRSPGDHWLPAFLAETGPAADGFLRARAHAPSARALA